MSGPEDEFLLHFARTGFFSVKPPARVGVAVSGGSDSMAALHLLAAAGFAVEAVTVDHRLRPEAADEARFVAIASARIGVPHTTLHWTEGPAPSGNLMDQARRARYALIAGWARGRGLADVAIAHTADDQAETFLMRLARDAGLDGLSAMRRNWQQDGVTFHRPFVGLLRADLRAYLVRHGVGWVEDPSNSDLRYDRVKARKALAALAPLGITADTLSGTAVRLAAARQALEWQVAQVAETLARQEAGDVIFPRRALLLQPPEVGRRLLIAALRLVSGAEYPPREPALIGLEIAITAGKDRTLSGCRILHEGPDFRITREPRALRGVETPTTGLWDGRWRLDGPHRDGLRIAALGAAGLKLCPGWRSTGLPRPALLVSPAIWDGDLLEAAPLAGKPGQWVAELAKDRRSLASFVLAH